jgi:peroxiredoxin
LLWLLAAFFAACYSDSAAPDLSSFLKDGRAAVFVFLAPDCPLSQNYTLTLNRLHTEFQDDGIAFYGVVAGEFEKNEIDGFTETYNVNFPVLQDHNFELVDSLGATKTPEAFVVKLDGKTLYKGAIDDWAVELGRHRRIVTRHYLSDVLNHVLNGHEILFSETPAVGCFIERKD